MILRLARLRLEPTFAALMCGPLCRSVPGALVATVGCALLVASTGISLGGWLASCAGGATPDPESWAAAAIAAHRQADQALATGDGRRARELLRELVSRTSSTVGLAEGDRRAVLMDTFFRLAELELGQERAQAGLGWCEQGLRLGVGRDLFGTNLLVARGRALELLGRDREAFASYRQALLINQALLIEAMRPERGPGGTGKTGGTGETGETAETGETGDR